MTPRVYINGQETRSTFDPATGIVSFEYVNLQGESIPPLPDKPKEESYNIQVTYETEFLPLDE